MINASNIAIVGAGLLGRLLAVELAKRSVTISLYEADSLDLNRPDHLASAAAFTAAGMIAPISEAIDADLDSYYLGKRSLKLWPGIIDYLHRQQSQTIDYQTNGSLIVAHPQDQSELDFFKLNVERLAKHCDAQHCVLNAQQIHQLEPDLSNHFERGIFLSEEAQLDNRQLMASLLTVCRQQNIQVIDNATVSINNNCVTHNRQQQHFDLVIDCRGIGAKEDMPNLRGVRGEVLRVESKEITLSRPIRLMHPRYQLYLAPKPNHQFVIGATQIESEDKSAISVQSMMELCSALYSISPAFAEARILEQNTNLRPALESHKPCIQINDKRITINGLFRHGYLIAPALIECTIDWLEGKKSQQFNHLFTFLEPVCD